MKVVTFFADAILPSKPAAKQVGFDWRGAVRALGASAAKSLGENVEVVTDAKTVIDGAILRTGDARAEGIMLWLLDAQAAAIRAAAGEQLLMVSPDTLIAGRLDCMFGDWDACLLTRDRPKPLVNSVIAVRASPKMADFWDRCARAARYCSPESRAWGADIDVLVDAIGIKPSEDCVREVDGVRFRLLPAAGVFRSIDCWGPVCRPKQPIWDFKGARKSRMAEYAALL